MTAQSIDELIGRAQRQLDGMRDASERLANISASATCPGCHVTATVDGTGALIDLTFSDAARGVDARVLGDVVVSTAARAAASAFAQRAAVLMQFTGELAESTRRVD